MTQMTPEGTRPDRRRPLAAAMLAVAAVLVAAAPSEAKLSVGIQVVRQTVGIATGAEVQRMRAGGTDAIRTTFDWSVAEPTQNGGFDFTEFDNLMRNASTGRKIEVMPALYSSPSWIAPANLPGEPPVGPQERARWANYVRAVIQRYGPEGSFFDQNPTTTYNPVRSWMVWNEPNLKNFWTDRHPDAKEYANFLKFTANVIRSTDPRAKVLLAGMPERQDAPHSMADFLEDLYRVKGFDKSFDVVALHPFAENQKGILGGIDRIREVVDDAGDKKKPMWVTEFGFASAGPNSPFTQNPKGQAKLLKKSLKLIKKKSKKYKVQKAIWYSWRDIDTDPPKSGLNNTWQTYTGLFTKNGQKKPSWNAFTDFTGGSPGSGGI
jgi:polysaccharide biosynthesis protein PslG